MAGNVIAASKACCEQTSAVFELPTQYAFPVSQTRGAADTSSLNRVTTSATFDLRTGLLFTQTDTNGRPTTMNYYPGSLRPKEIISPTGAITTFEYDDNAMKVTETSRLTANGTITGKTTKYLNGAGQVVKEEAEGAGNVIDIVDTIYDQFGRLSLQSRPYRAGDTPHFETITYDAAGRVSQVRKPDAVTTGSGNMNPTTLIQYFYNEQTRPAGASNAPGQTTRMVDPWGRWKWSRLNSSGKLAEVVEPNPVNSNANYQTKYSYDAFNNLIKVEQGDQIRQFVFDGLGRLVRQKSAEANASLDNAGVYQIAGGSWSDVFAYDGRSNLISHTDARGVKTLFSYKDSSNNDDPLNRLQRVSYDTSGVPSTLTVLSAPTVTYQYRPKSSPSSLIDVTQVKQVRADGISTEDLDYDTEGRLKERRLTFDGMQQPMTTTYGYDTDNRISQLTYPEQYQPNGNATRKAVTLSYDIASRLSALQVNGSNDASQVTYNAASQITGLVVGTGSTQLTESYSYDPGSQLLTNQTVQRSGNPLMNLSYWYQVGYGCEGCDVNPDPEMTFPAAYSEQVTKIVNYVSNREYRFSYDSFARLVSAGTGTTNFKTGQGTTFWGQSYSYDRYGNRTTVTPYSDVSTPVPDGYQSLSYDTTSNRITSAGFSYDPAGNQLTNGTGQSFIYDAAGRLAKVKNSSGVTIASYTYGASNHRLITQTGDENSATKTYYVWEGDSVITEYTNPSGASMPAWSKNYIYLGGRLLATEEPNGNGEIVHYHHPDRLGTRLVTNNLDSNYTQQATFPFGTALDAESTGATNRRFTSYDRSDTTGLDYAVNRHYDPRQGRFTQPDPLGMSAANLADPQSLNMYSYVGNDPMNRVDPNGQFWGALVQLIAGLFHNLKPNIINGSFAYHNHAPVTVSFTTNFQNFGIGYGPYQFPLRVEGQWLPELISQNSSAFDEAVAAAQGILSGNNPCSQFFGGAGLNALNGIANVVNRAGSKAFTMLADVSIGIAMSIPTTVPPEDAPLTEIGHYAYVMPVEVKINSQGAFRNMQTSSGPTLPRFGGYPPGSLQARVLQLFHETGHLVITSVSRTLWVRKYGKKKYSNFTIYRLNHLLPLDDRDPDLSGRNTDRVLGACRGEIDKLRN
jgi:RHS repeat-associated protein